MHFITFNNIAGYFGVLLVLIAFFGIQAEKLSQQKYTYSLLNLIGSIALLFSLYYHPNFPSIAIELAWTAISLFGIYRVFLKNRSQDKASNL